ncbi:methanogen output domain 1-containing protein [Allokutzneria albata]|uniref:Histidine kinase-like ATPase domain-containing protein n=1 Tax=Allokutzneria albata TaxID=211114 RepID=A0A1G9V0I4_ALLAB|nr:methanogen output domain 1-containing protein [Allokutzneria albata]SDM65629.1 Histidine kinase-like ATPase domain-containing protein [Allokutzneria albata]
MDWFVDRHDRTVPSALRREIRDYLARHSHSTAEELADAELIAMELTANALDHGSGPVWVTLEWTQAQPTLTVRDLGPAFALPAHAPDSAQPRGRGLWLVSQLSPELAVAARRVGKVVRSTLPVSRPVDIAIEPPRGHTVNPLPHLDEAAASGGFSRESFLRALVVQLANTIEQQQGPSAAQRAIAQVGADIGGQMEKEYRIATGNAEAKPLTPEQVAECLVRLKTAIGGTFRVVEVSQDRIVLVNSRCPFGPAVQRSPSLCRLTSAVFGGIAARSAGQAAVTLEERIALGDPGCRVVLHLGAASESPPNAHQYAAGS